MSLLVSLFLEMHGQSPKKQETVKSHISVVKCWRARPWVCIIYLSVLDGVSCRFPPSYLLPYVEAEDGSGEDAFEVGPANLHPEGARRC